MATIPLIRLSRMAMGNPVDGAERISEKDQGGVPVSQRGIQAFNGSLDIFPLSNAVRIGPFTLPYPPKIKTERGKPCLERGLNARSNDRVIHVPSMEGMGMAEDDSPSSQRRPHLIQ